MKIHWLFDSTILGFSGLMIEYLMKKWRKWFSVGACLEMRFDFCFSPCTFCSRPTWFPFIPLRDLTHARWPVVRAEEQTFFGLWSVFQHSIYMFFLPIIHVFLTTLMVFITYTTILTYKYPSILPYFLTPYHFLPLLTLFLYFSFFFLFQ